MSLIRNFESDTSPTETWKWRKSLELDQEITSSLAEAASDTFLSYRVMGNYIIPIPVLKRSTSVSYTQKLPDKAKHPRIKIKTTTEPSATAQSFDKIFNNFNNLLASLLDDYNAGRKDIADLVRELGGRWTPSSVVVILERLGANRNVLTNTLSKEDKVSILEKLSDIRESNQSYIYNDKEWIQREVIASQRIELIDVIVEDFIE